MIFETMPRIIEIPKLRSPKCMDEPCYVVVLASEGFDELLPFPRIGTKERKFITVKIR